MWCVCVARGGVGAEASRSARGWADGRQEMVAEAEGEEQGETNLRDASD